MNKNIFITAVILSTLISAPIGAFAATKTPPTDKQIKTQLLNIKKKQNTTKTNLSINKAQAKTTINKVKKQRAQKKALLKTQKNSSKL